MAFVDFQENFSMHLKGAPTMNCRKWLATVLSVLVWAPLTATAQQQPEPRPKLAIAVATGDELQLVTIGALVFWNSRGVLRNERPELANQLFAALRDEIGMENLYDIHRLALTTAEIRSFRPDLPRSRDFFGRSKAASNPDLLRILARCGCDKLLLVSSSNSNATAEPHTIVGAGVIAGGRFTWGLAFDLYESAAPEQYAMSGRASLRSARGGISVGEDVKWDMTKVSALTEEQWTSVEVTARDLIRPKEKNDRGSGQGHPLVVALSSLGLRPSCDSLAASQSSLRQRRDPNRGDYVPPSVLRPGDLERCPP
jgi:hypothetical protein